MNAVHREGKDTYKIFQRTTVCIDTIWFSFREIGTLVEIAIINGPKDRTFRAAHFRKAGEYYTPCFECSEKCPMIILSRKDIEEKKDQILHDPMNIEDLRRARRNVKPTTNQEEQTMLASFFGDSFHFEVKSKADDIKRDKAYFLGKILRTVGV